MRCCEKRGAFFVVMVTDGAMKVTSCESRYGGGVCGVDNIDGEEGGGEWMVCIITLWENRSRL